jgi:hypothetical protein
MDEQGYIKLWRKLRDNEMWKEKRVFSKAEAWIDILLSVSWKQNIVLIKFTPVDCAPGQSVKSVGTWAKRWRWSESKVRRYFNLLKKLGQIDVEAIAGTTRLTVLNWGIYNGERRASDAETDEQVESKWRASGEQVETEKKGKKEKKERISPHKPPREINKIDRSVITDPAVSVVDLCSELTGEWFSRERNAYSKRIKLLGEDESRSIIDTFWAELDKGEKPKSRAAALMGRFNKACEAKGVEL